MRRLAIMAMLLAAGCGGAPAHAPAPSPRATATRTAVPPPALCAGVNTRVLGHVDDPAATELSGLARTPDGLLWTHNDSGDGPRLFALNAKGKVLGETVVTGAQAVDWEDIAARGSTLYVADIGDNLASRPDVVVYRLREPAPGTPAAAEAIHLRYPDGPHDAEALLVDPRTGTLTIVTKSFGGLARIYTARKAGTLHHAGDLAMAAVTAGDVSADGRVIVLRNYDQARLWTRRAGESVAHALRRHPCDVPVQLLTEGQGEALALTRDGRAFYTVPEGMRPALRRYAAR